MSSYPLRNWDEGDLQPLEFADAVIGIAEFETVESAYKNKEYDRCLFYALQLLKRFPRNAYLVSRIGKVLIDLFQGKAYIFQYTADFSDELRLVNNFMHNLTTKECGEVAFHFLSNAAYFNPKEKSHYYLLWKISELTYRHEIKEKTKKAYWEVFGKSISTYEYK